MPISAKQTIIFHLKIAYFIRENVASFTAKYIDSYSKQIFLLFLFCSNQICEAKKMQFVSANRIVERKIDEDSEETYKTPQVLIDQLLELFFTGKLDDKIIRDQVETIVIAGNETTALSLSYITLLLAMYPDVQEKVYDEVHSVFETQDEEITYEHIQRLPYLDRVIKEGMRILPVVPFMMRTATADTQITDCTIPKEAFILMSIFNLHRVSLNSFFLNEEMNISEKLILNLIFYYFSEEIFEIFQIIFIFLSISDKIYGVMTLKNSTRTISYQKMSANDMRFPFCLSVAAPEIV